MFGAMATITISDGYAPVVGASVSGDFGGFGAGDACITDAAGQCTVEIEKIEEEGLPSVVFSVIDVVASELWYTFNPTAITLGDPATSCVSPPSITIIAP